MKNAQSYLNLDIKCLNHASLSISFFDKFKIIFDPWFYGNTFSDGWGLLYENNEAINEIKNADYLWISHFHADHFNLLTLKKIFEINLRYVY